jgi:hypothetical protein
MALSLLDSAGFCAGLRLMLACEVRNERSRSVRTPPVKIRSRSSRISMTKLGSSHRCNGCSQIGVEEVLRRSEGRGLKCEPFSVN